MSAVAVMHCGSANDSRGDKDPAPTVEPGPHGHPRGSPTVTSVLMERRCGVTAIHPEDGGAGQRLSFDPEGMEVSRQQHNGKLSS